MRWAEKTGHLTLVGFPPGMQNLDVFVTTQVSAAEREPGVRPRRAAGPSRMRGALTLRPHSPRELGRTHRSSRLKRGLPRLPLPAGGPLPLNSGGTRQPTYFPTILGLDSLFHILLFPRRPGDYEMLTV